MIHGDARFFAVRCGANVKCADTQASKCCCLLPTKAGCADIVQSRPGSRTASGCSLLRERPVVRIRRYAGNSTAARARDLEIVSRRSRGNRLQRKVPAGIVSETVPFSPDDRPAVFRPGDGRQERLSPKVMLIRIARSAERRGIRPTSYRPASVRSRRDLSHGSAYQAPMGQNRIMRTALERTVRPSAPCDRHHMTVLGAAFGRSGDNTTRRSDRYAEPPDTGRRSLSRGK